MQVATAAATDQRAQSAMPAPLPVPTSPGEQMTAYVIARLEAAGRAVLSLPRTGYTTALQTGGLDFVRQVAESYGWSQETIRPAAPSNRAITDMDEAYAWLGFIPDSQVMIRRIVGARSLVHPVTDRHLYPWRKLGNALQKHHTVIQSHHVTGIGYITAELIRVGFFR